MKFSIAIALTSAISGAAAHVTANPSKAEEGTYFSTSFRVPHGCGESSTTKVVIKYDEEMVKSGGSFTPQSLAGWKSSIISDGAPSSAGGISEAGTGESSSGVIYADGEIPYNMYGDFGVSFKLPMISSLPSSRNATLYFEVDQQCKNGEWQNWTTPGDKKYPPPQIKLTAAGAGSKSDGIVYMSSLPLLVFGFAAALYF